MKKIIYGLCRLSSIVLLSSCASIIHGINPNIGIPIKGQPEKADVMVDGKLIGQTPLIYKPKNRKTKHVQIFKDGYEEYNTSIKTQISPVWTGISIITGGWLLMIPPVIDLATGSLNNIKTEKIEYELMPENKKDGGIAIRNDKPIKGDFKSTNDASDEHINQANNFKKTEFSSFSKRMHVITGTREFFLGPKSCVSVTTKNGLRIGSNITEINEDNIVLAKNNTKIYYKDIKSIRIFRLRRWYPYLTAASIFPPIIWYANSKYTDINSSSCLKRIQAIETVDYFRQYNYGRDFCK